MSTQLKKLTMYNIVKEFSREGLSIRQISRKTCMDRVTVCKFHRMTDKEFSTKLALQNRRLRKLQPYEKFVKDRITDYSDCNVTQVESWMMEYHPDIPEVTTRTIYSFVQLIRKTYDLPKPKGSSRAYHAVEQLPYGEQAQVNFGEYWMASAGEHKVKVHFLIMLLSRSRRKFETSVSNRLRPVLRLKLMNRHLPFLRAYRTMVYDQDSTIVSDENRGAILYTDAFRKYLLHCSLKIHLCQKMIRKAKGKPRPTSNM